LVGKENNFEISFSPGEICRHINLVPRKKYLSESNYIRLAGRLFARITEGKPQEEKH
jgi:hypothetical protein